MGLPKAPRSFLEELADYDNPAPPEFDPEQDADQQEAANGLSADEGSIDVQEAREHYVDVGRSKLRRSDDVELGAQYEGASIGRDVFEEDRSDIEPDDPFGAPAEEFDSNDEGSEADEDEIEEAVDDFGSDGDDDDDDGNLDGQRVAAKVFASGSSGSADTEEEKSDDGFNENGDSDSDEDGDKEDDEGDDEGDDSVDEVSDGSLSLPDQGSTIPAKDNRAALRRMMAEERKSVAASLSAAAKADIAKGRAIKQQRATFDSLLNTRIKLQKALIATNSMAAVSEPAPAESENENVKAECAAASHAAEEAALNLWKSLSSLRESLDTSSKKRPLPPVTHNSNQSLWNEAITFESNARDRRRGILAKWSQRTNPTSAVQPQNRFSQAPAQAPLTSVLDRHLSGEGMERALKRTRVARSCAPVQAASSKTAVEDENVYDDADFYTLLLRELVDRRMEESRTTSSSGGVPEPQMTDVLPSQAELKVKRQVDTKASKGRKMRYTVHEKLENFMVADDRGSWGERQRAELFGSLLGRKVEMEENGGEEDERTDDDEEAGMEVDGLKLFGR